MEIVKKTIKNDETFLRQISKPVDLTNEDYKEIINVLKKFCINRERALAIASVQLGIPQRLIYVKKSDLNRLNEEYDEAKILINPTIIKQEGLTRYWETCASCLDYMGLVERPYKITVEYYDVDKKKHIEKFIGFESTVLSHEIDHLDGILHIDKSLEIYNMPVEQRDIFRKTHGYEIIKESGKFEPSKDKIKKFVR